MCGLPIKCEHKVRLIRGLNLRQREAWNLEPEMRKWDEDGWNPMPVHYLQSLRCTLTQTSVTLYVSTLWPYINNEIEAVA